MTRAENKEKYKEYDKTYYMKHRRPKTKIGQAEQRIADLEGKLAEKEEQYVQSLIEQEKEYDKQLEKQSTIHYRHLKEMEQDGLIIKNIYNENPPKVEYSLTPSGQALIPIMDMLIEWSFKYEQYNLEKEKNPYFELFKCFCPKTVYFQN